MGLIAMARGLEVEGVEEYETLEINNLVIRETGIMTVAQSRAVGAAIGCILGLLSVIAILTSM